jgi:LmbE family N-acetylglucosaminyl deacetylase
MLDIRNAVMVVAHPDDEIIWFSSLFDDCKGVLVCFGPSATSTKSWDSGRSALIGAYPIKKVKFLRVRQSDSLESANWNKPIGTDSGLRIRGRRTRSRYEMNADALLRILEVELKDARVIVTHNPWGEYGHEEHVQVFRTLEQLADKLGFELWVDAYVSDRSSTLMSKRLEVLESGPLICPTNKDLAHTLRTLYVQYGCWTWLSDYEWPAQEAFYRIRPSSERTGHTATASVPLTFLTHNFKRSHLRRLVAKALPSWVKPFIKRAVGIP